MPFPLARRTLPVLMALLLLGGCGAKTRITGQNQADLLPLEKDEAIAVLLGTYSHDQFLDQDPQFIARKRTAFENRLENCLETEALKRNARIRVIPARVVRDYLFQNYGIDDFEKPAARICDDLQHPGTNGAIEKTGLRYLVIADVATQKSSKLEPTFAGGGSGGAGIALLGLEKEGTREITAELHVIDVHNCREADTIELSSIGKEGWAAGVFIFIILPIPYYVPWWSLTETEICQAFGSSVLNRFGSGD